MPCAGAKKVYVLIDGMFCTPDEAPYAEPPGLYSVTNAKHALALGACRKYDGMHKDAKEPLWFMTLVCPGGKHVLFASEKGGPGKPGPAVWAFCLVHCLLNKLFFFFSFPPLLCTDWIFTSPCRCMLPLQPHSHTSYVLTRQRHCRRCWPAIRDFASLSRMQAYCARCTAATQPSARRRVGPL